MKKYVLLMAFSLLLLLSGCSAVEAEPETTPTETVPSAQQTVATSAETSSSADSDSTEAEESANPVDAEDMTDSEDAAEEEDEYGIMTLPLYIGLSVTDLTDGVATVRIDNRSGYEIEYDLCFNLEREVQPDEWERLESTEDIPTGNAVYSLPDLQQATVLCDLNPYGSLPDGHYRIEKDDLYAEFTLQDGALAED